MSLVRLAKCPICKSSTLLPKTTVKDQSISQEVFHLTQCADCAFLFTNPQPDSKNLWKYYESENYISHSKTTKGFINFWYRQVQHLNLRLKFKAIQRHVPRGTWLDYGAGAGDFVKFIGNKGIPITGLEPSETARKTALSNGVDLQDTASIQKIPNETIACISLWHVLEHITDFTDILKGLSDLLMKKGLLVLALPHYKSLDAQTYRENWAAYDVPRHLWHFTENDITALASSLDLELIDTRGMVFDSIYVSLLSEKYMYGSKLSGILNGIKSNLSAMQKTTPYSSQIYILRKKGI
jgi:2-polyprenyl-3-methyl-5-hydroxy-6-metoxy-1,4-benzoquinol methylase